MFLRLDLQLPTVRQSAIKSLRDLFSLDHAKMASVHISAAAAIVDPF